MLKIEQIGCIKNASLPDGWVEYPRPMEIELDDRSERIFHSSQEEGTEIVFFYRGVPVDEDSARRLSQILSSGRRDSLTAEEIRQLQVVMGYESVGNNQYTNPDGAVFQLEDASIRQIGRKSALQVKGKFRNGKHYKGIFYPADSTGQVIEELMIQSPSADVIEKTSADFDYVLSHLEWRDMQPD